MDTKERIKTLREQRENNTNVDEVTGAYIEFERQFKYLWEVKTSCEVYADEFESEEVRGINCTKNGLELILGAYKTFAFVEWLSPEDIEEHKKDKEYVLEVTGEPDEDGFQYVLFNPVNHKSGNEFIHRTLFYKKEKWDNKVVKNVNMFIGYDEGSIKIGNTTIKFELDKEKVNIDMITGRG